MHALQLTGSTGDYGRRLRAVVIGFGATARGAVTALSSPTHSASIVHLESDDTDPRGSHAMTDSGRKPPADFLAEHDLVVNCVLQDTEAPLMFLMEEDLDHSPSHLWDAATWEISEALLPHLRTVLSGPAAWEADSTIGRAIEIRDGVIRDPSVLAFQGRAAEYPHDRLIPAGQ
ncbi:hypothetical protein [Actinokineospora sp.]|uniref:hypothetical protein n=1 Tax=Actinokineospora sp. TaxID=1872133 RepID=UPI003D6A4DD2